MRTDNEALLPKESKRSSWKLMLTIVLFSGALFGAVLLNSKTPGAIDPFSRAALNRARNEDTIEDPIGEVSVGGKSQITAWTAAGVKSNDALCGQLLTDLGGETYTNVKYDNIANGGPLFGIEVEYHNRDFVTMANDAHFFILAPYANPGDELNGAGWDYPTHLATVTYKKDATTADRILIEFEAETQSRLEAATGTFNAFADTHGLFKCTVAMMAKIRPLIRTGPTLKKIFENLIPGVTAEGPCQTYAGKLKIEIADVVKNAANEGGYVWKPVKSLVTQVNFGAPVTIYDPLLLGNVKSNGYSDRPGLEKEGQACNAQCALGVAGFCGKCGTGVCKANKCAAHKIAKAYGDNLPNGIANLKPLGTLQHELYKADVLKLQMIQNTNVRSIVTMWREVQKTLERFTLTQPRKNRPTKGNFNLLPKYKMDPNTDLYKKAKAVYIKLFGNFGPYQSGDCVGGTCGYGSRMMRDPQEGIRGNYDNADNSKSIRITEFTRAEANSRRQIYVVEETRSNGAIVTALPEGGQFTWAKAKDGVDVSGFITSLKGIQSWGNKQSYNSYCKVSPGMLGGNGEAHVN